MPSVPSRLQGRCHDGLHADAIVDRCKAKRITGRCHDVEKEKKGEKTRIGAMASMAERMDASALSWSGGIGFCYRKQLIGICQQ